MTLNFVPMFMSYSLAKVQGQRSVGSEDRVETHGRSDGGDCITSLANAVDKSGEGGYVTLYGQFSGVALESVWQIVGGADLTLIQSVVAQPRLNDQQMIRCHVH